jgi:pyruvate ferredoxin oxidoreductase gamma subunit
MLRIRFHGRGGQGIKTASQILGTAGFYSGFQAQDFPLYGAERRGAPIVAYTRMDEEPILERGPIIRPDILVIGDETLLDDPIAAVRGGTDEATAIFVNSSHSPDELKKHLHLKTAPFAANLTDLCLTYLQKGTALSSAIAAAGARMTGRIGIEALIAATRDELRPLGIGDELLQANLKLARLVFETVPQAALEPRRDHVPVAARLIAMGHRGVADAAPIILAKANMGLRKTGNWRIYRPEIDFELCNNCWICFARCPDGAIAVGMEQKPVIDYDHCKGCMICARECPARGIRTLREVTSWT